MRVYTLLAYSSLMRQPSPFIPLDGPINLKNPTWISLEVYEACRVYLEGQQVFSLEVLDLTEEGLMKMFVVGVSQFTPLSLAILYPTPIFTF